MNATTRACVALTALLGAVSFSATADAGRGHGHGPGGHGWHGGQHHGHWHGHHHHHRGWGWGPTIGFGWSEPYYSYYDDEDCYRIYRRGRYRIVCD